MVEYRFFNREKANLVLDKLYEIQKNKGFVTLADYYMAVGMETLQEDSKFGWTDVEKARVKFVQVGPYIENGYYLIEFPDIRPIDKQCPVLETNIHTKQYDAAVDHPSHYKTKAGIEAIDVIEAFTEGLEGKEAVCTGNAIKYILRWHNKNGLQDLKKCRWYLNRLIKHIEEKEND